MSLELRNLTKRLGRVEAIRDVSLACGEGEFIALVGPSGCGKTTLLRLIAGLEQIDAGEVCIRGIVVNRLPPRARNVAMVFQGESLYPHMSVRQNLEFPLSVRNTSQEEISARVERVARQYGIDEWLDRDPATLSGGQRQRVALGRAMVREPVVCLLDEPFAHLDVHLRRQLQKELQILKHAWSATTIFVTHDLQEAMLLGDRVAVMCEGVLHQFDTPERIRDRPATGFVAEFLHD